MAENTEISLKLKIRPISISLEPTSIALTKPYISFEVNGYHVETEEAALTKDKKLIWKNQIFLDQVDPNEALEYFAYNLGQNSKPNFIGSGKVSMANFLEDFELTGSATLVLNDLQGEIVGILNCDFVSSVQFSQNWMEESLEQKTNANRNYKQKEFDEMLNFEYTSLKKVKDDEKTNSKISEPKNLFGKSKSLGNILTDKMKVEPKAYERQFSLKTSGRETLRLTLPRIKEEPDYELISTTDRLRSIKIDKRHIDLFLKNFPYQGKIRSRRIFNSPITIFKNGESYQANDFSNL